MIAIRKRIATNETGGRSRNPILMASQVELQTRQSVSHANGTPHPALGRHLFCTDTLIIFTRAREHRALAATRKADANKDEEMGPGDNDSMEGASGDKGEDMNDDDSSDAAGDEDTADDDG